MRTGGGQGGHRVGGLFGQLAPQEAPGAVAHHGDGEVHGQIGGGPAGVECPKRGAENGPGVQGSQAQHHHRAHSHPQPSGPLHIGIHFVLFLSLLLNIVLNAVQFNSIISALSVSSRWVQYGKRAAANAAALNRKGLFTWSAQPPCPPGRWTGTSPRRRSRGWSARWAPWRPPRCLPWWSGRIPSSTCP